MDTNEFDSKLVTQCEIDEMLRIHEIIDQDEQGVTQKSLIDEIREAILDSGKLTLPEWKSLRRRIAEIEDLIPHMDTLIMLKEQHERRRQILGR
ncbi:MAG: hypothetical protein QNK37_34850 [Acidobacteriota bacterium]|nr:hypothetical protein [Acidobacteriota bacterium]